MQIHVGLGEGVEEAGGDGDGLLEAGGGGGDGLLEVWHLVVLEETFCALLLHYYVVLLESEHAKLLWVYLSHRFSIIFITDLYN